MKKWILVLLTALFLFHLAGCQKEAPAPVGPAFYYRAADISYSMESTVVRAEYRENAAYDTLQQMLVKYFAGPESTDLRTPFPVGMKLIEVSLADNTVYITVSDALSSLSGLELTLACSCISLTCLDFTGAELVVISAQDSLLDGQKYVTMDKNTLLLLDTVLEGE